MGLQEDFEIWFYKFFLNMAIYFQINARHDMHGYEWICRWKESPKLRSQGESYLLVTEYTKSGNEARRSRIMHARRWMQGQYMHDTTELQCVYDMREATRHTQGKAREGMVRMYSSCQLWSRLAIQREKTRLTAHEKRAMRMLSSDDGSPLSSEMKINAGCTRRKKKN